MNKTIVFCKSNPDTLPIVECQEMRTYSEQVLGLQGHNSLPPSKGMLFSYASSSPLSYWMGSVKFPIDIIFADDKNKIVKIYHNCQPRSQEIYSCASAKSVVEVIGNYCIAENIQEGDKVHFAEDNLTSKEQFVKFVLESIIKLKQECQAELGMEKWSIKVVMEGENKDKKFIRVNWNDEDYAIRKAKIVVNPDAEVIKEFFMNSGFTMKQAVKHALIHIKIGVKKELSKEKERILVNRYMNKKSDKKVVFDMDETLLHTFSQYGGKPFSKDNADFRFELGGEMVWGKVRPGMLELINTLGKKYPLYVFSAAPKDYVYAALDAAGIKEYFDGIFTGENLTLDENNDNDVKDLRLISPDLNDVVVIDNAPGHYPGELADRLIPIQSYYGSLLDDNLGEIEQEVYNKLSTNKKE